MWEVQAKKDSKLGRFHRRHDKPFVNITRRGIIFNKEFLKKFDLKRGDCVIIMWDKVSNRVGFRAAKTATEQDIGYKLSALGKSAHCSALICDKFTGKLPADCLDKFYLASLPAGGTIITVNLYEVHVHAA